MVCFEIINEHINHKYKIDHLEHEKYIMERPIQGYDEKKTVGNARKIFQKSMVYLGNF